MNVWIQRYDFDQEEYDFQLADEASLLFDEFDWKSELEKQKENIEGSCDPGMGLVVGDGHILHIAPDEEENAQVFLHYPEPSKILWIFNSSTQKILSKEGVPKHKVHQLIQMFYQGRYEDIKSEL